jgi:endonuclease/exonuclease/phosphatase family metal-dependent hydrolase
MSSSLVFPLFLLAIFATTEVIAQSPPDQPIRVLTFNVLRQEWSHEGDPTWAQRKPGAAAVLAEIQPDLVGLQEETQNQLEDLLASAPKLQPAGARPSMGGSILYRRDKFEVHQYGIITIGQNMEHFGGRSMQWALLREKDTGSRILFYNTHPSPFDEAARIQAAELLLRHVTTFPEPYDYLLMVGDFNASEANDSIKMLFAHENPRLRSAWREAHGFPNIDQTARLVAKAREGAKKLDEAEAAGATISDEERKQIDADVAAAGQGSFHGYKPRVRPGPIDYILVPPNVKVVKAEILTGQYKGFLPSDHYPVWADLLLGTPAKSK